MCNYKVGCGLLIAGSLAIGVGVLLGGFLPNSLLAKRLIQTTCNRYYTVWDHYCTRGGITKVCYDVQQNTQPDKATCWEAPTIAVFEHRNFI
jgi:hypothetical protein